MFYETKQKILTILFFPLFNLIVLSLYIINFDLPKSSVLLKLITFVLFLTLLSIFTFRSKFLIFKSLYNLQVSLFSIICLFFILEIVYKIRPSFFPLQLTNYLSSEDIGEIRKTKVEYLNESPYVKFRPNTVITSQGWRGSKDQFVYDWKTDKNGFKNLDKISNLNEVDIVVLGSSFTEGLGVATEKIWPSLLMSKGFSAYNLAVQGYAPIQFLGSLKKYGVQLKPNYIIIGYTLGIYEYELLDEKKVIEEKSFAGGINSIVNAELMNNIDEIKIQARYIFSALWLITKRIRYHIKNFYYNLSYLNITLSDRKFNLYKKEIMSIAKYVTDESILSNSNNWKSTLNNFKNIIDIAYSINAKVILLIYPQRSVIYFERATGEKLPRIYNGIFEIKLLKEFADKENILFINLNNRLINYVNNLQHNFNVKSLPYLEIDGHINNIGHGFVAEEIIEVINKEKSENVF